MTDLKYLLIKCFHIRGGSCVNGHLGQDCHILAVIRIAASSMSGDGCICMYIFYVFIKLF